MSSRAFKVLVFDWDGTLSDSAGRIVEAFALAAEEMELAPRPSADLRNVIGLGLEQAIAQLYGDLSPPQAVELAHGYRQHFAGRYLESPPLFAGVPQVLQHLQADGYRLAVATGKSRRGLAREILAHDLEPLFESTRCADETASKPNPQMLHELIDELAVEAGELLMIGDTTYDLEMAQSASVAGLGVTYGVHEKRRLLDFQPLALIDAIEELPEFLSRYQSVPAPHPLPGQ